MTAQVYDDQIGPLVITYWATVERLLQVVKNAGQTNAAAQVIATALLGQRQTAYGAGFGNSQHIAVAAGLAANNWS